MGVCQPTHVCRCLQAFNGQDIRPPLCTATHCYRAHALKRTQAPRDPGVGRRLRSGMQDGMCSTLPLEKETLLAPGYAHNNGCNPPPMHACQDRGMAHVMCRYPACLSGGHQGPWKLKKKHASGVGAGCLHPAHAQLTLMHASGDAKPSGPSPPDQALYLSQYVHTQRSTRSTTTRQTSLYSPFLI